MNHIKSYANFKINELFGFFEKENLNVSKFIEIIKNAKQKVMGDAYVRQFTFERYPHNLPSGFPIRFPSMGRGLKPSVNINCKGLNGELFGQPIGSLTVQIYYTKPHGWLFDVVKDGSLVNKEMIKIKNSTLDFIANHLFENGNETTGAFVPSQDRIFSL